MKTTITHNIMGITLEILEAISQNVKSATITNFQTPWVGNDDYACDITVLEHDEHQLGQIFCSDPQGFIIGQYSERTVNS